MHVQLVSSGNRVLDRSRYFGKVVLEIEDPT